MDMCAGRLITRQSPIETIKYWYPISLHTLQNSAYTQQRLAIRASSCSCWSCEVFYSRSWWRLASGTIRWEKQTRATRIRLSLSHGRAGERPVLGSSSVDFWPDVTCLYWHGLLIASHVIPDPPQGMSEDYVHCSWVPFCYFKKWHLLCSL